MTKSAPGEPALEGEHLFLIFVTSANTRRNNWEVSYCRGDTTKLEEHVRRLTQRGRKIEEIVHPYKKHYDFVQRVLEAFLDPELNKSTGFIGLEPPVNIIKAQRIVDQSRGLPAVDLARIEPLIQPVPTQTITL